MKPCRAFAIAKEGRPGPVLVDVPSYLQAAELEWPELEYGGAHGCSRRSAG